MKNEGIIRRHLTYLEYLYEKLFKIRMMHTRELLNDAYKGKTIIAQSNTHMGIAFILPHDQHIL